MYHKTDQNLNRQIKDLSRIKISVSLRRILLSAVLYFTLLPIVVYIAGATNYDIILYIYLVPLAPIVFVTYMTFTGKLKWVIRLAHKLLHTRY